MLHSTTNAVHIRTHVTAQIEHARYSISIEHNFSPILDTSQVGALCRARERGELIRYSGAIQGWWVSDAPSWGNLT